MTVNTRAEFIFETDLQRLHARTDRMFAALMGIQFIAGIAVALWVSPQTWSGPMATSHVHVWAAILLGGAISFVPIAFALLRPGEVATRHVIAIGQALTSELRWVRSTCRATAC
ncbi:MAG: hypothetical protein JKY65_06215 [Planctomycetes bacterium]|nr:hypothetical protein [Planctomycetota bacterium]